MSFLFYIGLDLAYIKCICSEIDTEDLPFSEYNAWQWGIVLITSKSLSKIDDILMGETNNTNPNIAKI